MASDNESSGEMSDRTIHLQTAIGAVGNYLMSHLKKNIDEEETCEYLQEHLDENLGKLCDTLISVPSDERITNVWHAIEQIIYTVPLSMMATIKIAIGLTEAKVIKARAKYTSHHEKWLNAYLAREKEDPGAKKAQEDHRLKSAALKKESGNELFFQKNVLKLLSDVQTMVEDIKKEKAYHETHCLKDLNTEQN